MTIYTEIQEALDRVNKIISEELTKRITEVTTHYFEICAIKDREIEFLKKAIFQSALDFQRLQERTNGDQPCCQSSTPNR